MLSPKLKYFLRLDGSGRVIPGSGVYRKSQPRNGRWITVTSNPCCAPADELMAAYGFADSTTLAATDTTGLHFFMITKATGAVQDVTASATFVSSNTAAVTVSGSTATAVATGTSTITGTYEGFTVSIPLTVS